MRPTRTLKPECVEWIEENEVELSLRCMHRPAVVTVKVDVPEELIALADTSETPSRSASKIIALELFREGRVSAGKAAELAGISLQEFLAFAAERNVPMHYTVSDWQEDQATSRELKS
jgi:predicted HTH domain antitoxin